MNLLLTKKIKNKNNHVNPNKWNSLISDKNTYLIDARKPFEYNVGTFKKANNPNIQNFRDFPKYLTKLNKDKPIAMFCTGGIRCEKASVYLEKKGFKNIYQLKGGIINYLKKIGYRIEYSNSNQLKKLIKIFQMRFRPELVDGKLDQECNMIAKSLVSRR